jgi:hypothetical protein
MKQYVYEIEIQVTHNMRVTLESTDIDTATDEALTYAESVCYEGADFNVIRRMNLGDADEGKEYETVPY